MPATKTQDAPDQDTTQTATEARTTAEPLVVDAKDEAAGDKKLDDLMARHEGEEGTDADSPSPSKGRDEKGQFKKGDETIEVEDDEETVDARSALERDGWSADDLDAMDQNRVLALGQKARKRQTDTDAAYKNHETTAQQLADLKNGLGKITDPGTPAAEDKTGDPFEAIAQHAKDMYGDEDFGKVLREPFDRLDTRMSKVESDISSVLDEVLRDKVAADYPELKDEESFARVVKRMQQLDRPGAYPGRAALMRDSAKVEFADDRAASAAKIQRKARSARDASTQPPPDRTGMSVTKVTINDMSYDQLDEALLDAMIAEDVPLQGQIKARLVKLR